VLAIIIMLRLDFTMVLSSDNTKRPLPNAVATWVDPFWTGVWHVIDDAKVVDGANVVNGANVIDSANVFRVSGTLKPLQPSWYLNFWHVIFVWKSNSLVAKWQGVSAGAILSKLLRQHQGAFFQGKQRQLRLYVQHLLSFEASAYFKLSGF